MPKIFRFGTSFFLALAGFFQVVLWQGSQSLGRLIYAIYRGKQSPHIPPMTEKRRDAIIDGETSNHERSAFFRDLALVIAALLMLIGRMVKKKT